MPEALDSGDSTEAPENPPLIQRHPGGLAIVPGSLGYSEVIFPRHNRMRLSFGAFEIASQQSKDKCENISIFSLVRESPIYGWTRESRLHRNPGFQ